MLHIDVAFYTDVKSLILILTTARNKERSKPSEKKVTSTELLRLIMSFTFLFETSFVQSTMDWIS